jgi:uncharacterized protein YbbC (DUF1343 family)
MLWTGAEAADMDGFSFLQGRRVAVVCNPSSLVRAARLGPGRHHLVDALRSHGVQIVRLFGPEHGLWSTAQDLIPVEGGRDPVFDLEVATLYGRSVDSLTPRPEVLRGLDVVVFDVQDVGARYYTYAATLCMTLAACAKLGVQVVVLDRPNPLGGETVEGNEVTPNYRSFVGYIDLPQRHGLTLGEIGRLYVHEHGLDVDLKVVACSGWDPALHLDECDDAGLGSPWYAPSPNMPTVATAVVYPGTCLVEGTKLSEGRGTTRPFELVGAPWIDARKLADRLMNWGIPGLLARPMRYEPTFQKFAGQACGGVALEVTNRQVFPSVRAGVAVIQAMREQDVTRFEWRTEVYEFVSDRLAIDLLMGGTHARTVLEAGGDYRDACSDFAQAERAFARRALPHLIYPRARGVLADSDACLADRGTR